MLSNTIKSVVSSRYCTSSLSSIDTFGANPQISGVRGFIQFTRNIAQQNTQPAKKETVNGQRILRISSVACGVPSDHVSVSWPCLHYTFCSPGPSLARLQAQPRPAWLRLRHRRPSLAWPEPPPLSQHQLLVLIAYT